MTDGWVQFLQDFCIGSGFFFLQFMIPSRAFFIILVIPALVVFSTDMTPHGPVVVGAFALILLAWLCINMRRVLLVLRDHIDGDIAATTHNHNNLVILGDFPLQSLFQAIPVA